jgi:hypothetical protein
MLYRPHRGGLAESMAEAKEFDGSWTGLQLLLPSDFILTCVKPYGYDDRIDWDTHVVVAQFPDGNVGAVGFINGHVDRPIWK